MNLNNRKLLFFFAFCFCTMAMMTFFCPDSFAAEKMPAWRKTYNTIMLWVNFGILAAVFLKFARKPLVNAIRGVRDKVAAELSEIKNRLSDVKSDFDAESDRFKSIDEHLEQVRARIIEMGQKEKENIIEQAKIAAEKMISDAETYAKVQMDRARRQLSDDMVDIAISMVEKKLKKEITKEDNEKLVSDFLIGLQATKSQLN